MKKVQGFTLIELMIVIAILGILLAIAIPAYQDYTVRTKVSECFNLQTPVKLQLSEYFISNGSFPAVSDVATSRTTEWCQRSTYVRTAGGGAGAGVATIQVDAIEGPPPGVGSPAGTIQGILTGYGCANNDVEWTCSFAAGGDTFTGRFLPATCRTSTTARPTTC
jgi:prepilin-type N-terminal cleavage/methylation domain-containing protein